MQTTSVEYSNTISSAYQNSDLPPHTSTICESLGVVNVVRKLVLSRRNLDVVMTDKAAHFTTVRDITIVTVATSRHMLVSPNCNKRLVSENWREVTDAMSRRAHRERDRQHAAH